MKRNRKYNKEIPKETFMNGLRHIVFILIIGFAFADTCDDPSACNDGDLNNDCTYAEENFDCDGNCIAEVDCAGVCGGSAVVDECGVCGGDGSLEGYTCDGIPELFTFNQSTQQAFYYFDSVTINGDNVDPDDWVGAFKGDICVGARKWDTSSCGNGVCDVSVMGDQGADFTEGYMNTGEIPTFKIYDASEDVYYDAIASGDYEWAPNGFFNNNDNLNGGILGCTDSEACNYDSSATVDDGSCLEMDCAGECGGSAVLSGCDNVCGSTLENDACDVCGGDGSTCVPPGLTYPEELQNHWYFSDQNNYSDAGCSQLINCSDSDDVSCYSQNGCEWNGEECIQSETIDDMMREMQFNSDGTALLIFYNDEDNCETTNDCDSPFIFDIPPEFIDSFSCEIETGSCHFSVFSEWGMSDGDLCFTYPNDDYENNPLTWFCGGINSSVEDQFAFQVLEDDDNCTEYVFDNLEGCTDSAACNFDNNALEDDDSCEYAETNYDCDGNCTAGEDCLGECGGSAELDECGVCGGDNSSCSDCDGVPNGDAELDNCGVCDSDTTNDNDCPGEYDNCGVWDGNNSDCWFIDITTGIGSVGEIVDSLSRIGMHEAAADDFNAEDIPGYTCENCYKDELDSEFNDPTNWIDFYFPHPEWEDEIPDIFGTTDLRKDIRYLETFTVADLDNNTAILVNEKIYYIQQAWDIKIETDPNIWNLPYVEDFVKLDFNFINQIPNSDEFTKIFFYKDNNGNAEIEEITRYGGSFDPTCLSDFCIVLDDFELLTNLRIILGTDTVQPSATITSPIPNEIFALDEYNFQIELDIDNLIMIDHLEFYFEVDNLTSPVISIEPADAVGGYVSIYKNEYYDFLDGLIDGNYIDSVYLHVEIIDIAEGSVNNHLNGEYHHDIGPLTFSRGNITTEFETGWHLLSPPLAANHILDNIFANPAYDCSDGCIQIDTAYSGTGFYVESNGDYSDFTFNNGEVLSDFSSPSPLQQGWNLIGNPLVTPIDINSVRIKYNSYDDNWPDAAKHGIISPIPMIFDNEIGGHVGTDSLSTAAGFWVYSYEDNVDISFIPSNPTPEVEPSLYWNLSLIAKEDNTGGNFDESIGSEIVIGIHEDANNAIVDGEDQEAFPLSSISIFNRYTGISIINNGTSSIYQDIRSYHETSITWDLEGESEEPFDADQGIKLSWEFSGNDDPYDYYLDIGTGAPVNMKPLPHYANVSQTHFAEGMSITAVLQVGYIGCTHPLADNYNKLPDSDVDCAGGTCLGGNQSEYCNILSLSLPEDYSINPDDVDQALELPISITNPQGLDIEGLNFVLEYDFNFIQLNEVNLSDTLNNNNYAIYQQNDTTSIPAELSVTVYFNPDPDGSDEIFSGGGEILSLSGKGLSTTAGTPISFTSVQINENANSFGNECIVTIGYAYYNISGGLIYYKNGASVSGSSIKIVEIGDLNNSFSTTTNSDGNFNLESVIGNLFYEIILSKDEYGGYLDNYFDGLSAVDASRIARYGVGLFPFNDKQKLAANVNFDYRCENEDGNPPLNEDGDPFNYNEFDCVDNGFNWMPIIGSGDASKVARYAAGIIDDLDNHCDPHWIFRAPDGNLMLDKESCEVIPSSGVVFSAFELDSLISSINDLVFEGIRLGDVTGNWSAPLGRQNEDYFVDNPMVEVEPDEIIKLPIYLPNNVEIEGIDLTIEYDPEVFSLIGYSNRNSILEKSTYPTIINEETSGLFKLVSYANSTPINDNGLLGYIKFKVVSQTTAHSTISMVEMEVNEIPEGGFLIVDGIDSGNISRGFDFQIIAVPDVFALNQNYPNPFNPSTNIQFELPIDGEVEIFIYDLKGSLIDELMNGYMEAGYHQIKWDGSRQASGMYFIRMIADNGNYIKMSKMMLVK